MEPVIREGETYPLDRQLDRTGAFEYWMRPDNSCFVAEIEGEVVGSYYLRANTGGGGKHVANCGYMVAPSARGKGVARSMCEHSLEEARRRGFTAMQFNLVISSNEVAVHLWQAIGFEVVGRLPQAFESPKHGFVDAVVMFRKL